MHQKLFYRSHFLMNSRFELFIPELESENLIQLFNEIVDKIENLEKAISRFLPDSEISLLNKTASVEAVKVDETVFELIERCIHFYQKTFGYFNIAAGSLSSQKLNIQLNNTDRSVYFGTSEVLLDFGGIGKGFALESAIQIIKKSHIENALINFGDSSVYAIGSHPQGDYWPVTISNGQNSQTFNLKNNGLSSSGLHVNIEEDIAHIINPFTGKLVNKKEKVVVLSKCPVRAEVLSTAIYAADNNTRDEIKKEFVEEEVFVL